MVICGILYVALFNSPILFTISRGLLPMMPCHESHVYFSLFRPQVTPTLFHPDVCVPGSGLGLVRLDEVLMDSV